MKHMTHWLVCGAALLATAGHAEPAHKTSARGVDLEAAARATAALYAAPSAALAARVSPASSPVGAYPAIRPVSQSERSSPLLPAAAQSGVAAVVVGETSAPAGEVWAGAYHCEHAEKVMLRPAIADDQVELQWKGQRWNLRRIQSRSGAMRLEDGTARMVWIQLPNKSMLLDQRQGKRLLDECQHDVQVQTAAQMKNNPPPALFDTRGMGR